MTRTHSHRVAAAVLLSALSTAAQSTIFEKDDRRYVRTTPGSIYSPVGVVSHNGTFLWHRSTGFLVDNCHVLTTQTGASSGYGRVALGKRVKFQTGISTPQHQTSKATVVAAGGVERPRTELEQSERGGQDWVLLKLDRCLGASAGHVILSPGFTSRDDSREVQSVGYPTLRPKNNGLTIDPSCRVIWGRGTVWLNDCATVRGDAGDPLYRITRSITNPQMVVYAMQAAAYSTDGRPVSRVPGYENIAVPMGPIIPQIMRYLSFDWNERVATK